MKINLKNVNAASVLTKDQMRTVLGGASAQGCCAHTAGWGQYQCGYGSLAEAQAAADHVAATSGVRTFYCCDSCPQVPTLS